MINILFITPDFYPNSTGFANACVNLVNSIVAYGSHKYDVHVYTEKPLGEKPELKECKVIRYLNTGAGKIGHLINERKKVQFILKYIEENNIDIIFFETNTFPFIECEILQKYKDKCIVRIHSTADTEVPIYGKKRTIGQKIASKRMFEFMKDVPYILSTSNYYLDFVKTRYLYDNVYSVWNGKTYGILYNTSLPTNYSKESCAANHFLSMGKLSDNGLTQKGMVDLLKAVFFLKKMNWLPSDFLLTIVGTGEKLPYITNLINKLDLTNTCRIIESATHDEVFDLMNNSKAIVLLSRYEGQSMFITESISMGKPIIISDDNGMGDMLVDGVNGFQVRTGDIESAAQAIKKVCELSKEEIEMMGEASFKLYKEKYSPRKVYEKFDILMTLKD